MVHALDGCLLLTGPHLSRQWGVKSIGTDGGKGGLLAIVLGMLSSAVAHLEDPAQAW